MEKQVPIGITGGTGLYEMPELEVRERVTVKTPFGEPSDDYVLGSLSGANVAFLSRHGKGHRLPANSVNYRANIYGFKSLGVDCLIGVSAVGSMKDELRPTEIVVPSQYYDNTKKRENTFFLGSPAVHVDLADPTCPVLDRILVESGRAAGVKIHGGGTYVCIEGPGFSSRAESKIYRGMGIDIIGMSAATEMKLCREAEMCYSSLACVTDYDVWKESAEDVSVKIIIQNLFKCTGFAKKILVEAIPSIPPDRGCACRSALANSIVTNPEAVDDQTYRGYGVLLEKYLPHGR